MKWKLLLELIRRGRFSAPGKRTLMLAGGVGLLAVTMIGVATIWVASFAVGTVGQLVQAQGIPDVVQSKSQVAKDLAQGWVGKLEPCWRSARSLFGTQAWIERPVLQNLQEFKSACVGGVRVESSNHQEAQS